MAAPGWGAEDVALRCEDLGVALPGAEGTAGGTEWYASETAATQLAAALLNEEKGGWGEYCQAAQKLGCVQDVAPPFAPDKAVALCGFLATHAQTQRLLACEGTVTDSSSNSSSPSAADATSSYAAALRRILMAILPQSTPLPASSTPISRLSNILIQELSKLPADQLLATRELLMHRDTAFSPADAALFEDILEAMNKEYALRQKMMLQRLDVTLQSFLWSARAQGQKADIIAACRPLVAELHEAQLGVTLDEVLHADTSLVDAMYTPVTEMRGRTSLKGAVVGKVPDRGGRVEDVRPRDLMPSWAPRSSGSGRSHGRGFHGGNRGDSTGRKGGNSSNKTKNGGGSGAGGGNRNRNHNKNRHGKRR